MPTRTRRCCAGPAGQGRSTSDNSVAITATSNNAASRLRIGSSPGTGGSVTTGAGCSQCGSSHDRRMRSLPNARSVAASCLAPSRDVAGAPDLRHRIRALGHHAAPRDDEQPFRDLHPAGVRLHPEALPRAARRSDDAGAGRARHSDRARLQAVLPGVAGGAHRAGNGSCKRCPSSHRRPSWMRCTAPMPRSTAPTDGATSPPSTRTTSGCCRSCSRKRKSSTSSETVATLALSALDAYRDRFYVDIYFAARTWRARVEAARRAGRALGPSRYIEVRYEALTADPEAELRSLCAFLGEPFDPAMCEPHRLGRELLRPRGRHAPVRQPPRANSGRWQREMTPADRRLFDCVAAPLLGRARLRVLGRRCHDLRGAGSVRRPRDQVPHARERPTRAADVRRLPPPLNGAALTRASRRSGLRSPAHGWARPGLRPLSRSCTRCAARPEPLPRRTSPPAGRNR